MADGSLESLIVKTQEVLQPLIAKPKLADKLLAKPPFRFLHDILTALQQATGFPQGLYNAFEADSANIKDKNQKLAYLDKIIVCVGLCAGKELDVRSAKIVAGLEPENTNVLLQELARVASNKGLDWGKAVQKTLEKVPSLAADGTIATAPVAATPAAVAAPPLAQEKPAASVRPSSKERGDGEKAAPAEAKSEAKKPKAEPEPVAVAAAAPAQEKKVPAEAKAPPPAASAAATPAGDDVLQQQIRACTGDFEKTKEAVEQVIAKPKMSVKLLSKPPFRFLHDIVSEVTRVTGFADGLYTPEELDSNNIKEKQPKIDYLSKIIACVSCHLNVEVEARPAKIVAGLEPEQTCQFLQLMAIACRLGSSATAVQRVLAGDTALRPTAAITAAAPAAAKASAPPPASTPALAPKAESVAVPAAESKSQASTPVDAKPRAKEQPPAAEPEAKAAPRAPKPTEEDEDTGNLRFPAAQAKDAGDGGSDAPSMAPGTSGVGTTSRTSRPTTARRRPPKLKENVTEVGRLMVPDAKTTPVTGLMKDGANAEDDDDGGEEIATPNGTSSNASRTSTPEDGNAVHGRMLQEILKEEAAARKQKEDEDAKATAASGPTLETETGIRLGRRNKSFKGTTKGAAASTAAMQELRASIQQICQATLPMGKCIEFVHEDLDAMAKELERWRKEYDLKCEAYAEEKKKTDKELQPLQVKLREVEEEIKEQVHKINSLKATIVKNEDKTQQMLRSVVSA